MVILFSIIVCIYYLSYNFLSASIDIHHYSRFCSSYALNPFGNEVASAFCLKRRCNLFGKKNTFYCVWAPCFFASESQEKKKQHFTALWTLFTLNLISMNSVAHTVQWTVQEICTVHLKYNEQCNSLTLFKSELHCSHTFFFFTFTF